MNTSAFMYSSTHVLRYDTCTTLLHTFKQYDVVPSCTQNCIKIIYVRSVVVTGGVYCCTGSVVVSVLIASVVSVHTLYGYGNEY